MFFSDVAHSEPNAAPVAQTHISYISYMIYDISYDMCTLMLDPLYTARINKAQVEQKLCTFRPLSKLMIPKMTNL